MSDAVKNDRLLRPDQLGGEGMRAYVDTMNDLADRLYQETGQGEDAPDVKKNGGWNLIGINGASAYELSRDALAIADDPSRDLEDSERAAFYALSQAAEGLGDADAAASPLNAPFDHGQYYEGRRSAGLIDARVSLRTVEDFLESRETD